jgi:CRISPR/Cas system-associated protein endoribonuclease Cas2
MAENDNDSKPNPAEAFQNLLAKNNNDATALASRLFDENFQYRQQIRELKQSAPKEGSLVLSETDAKEFNKFKQLLSDSKIDFKQAREMVEKFADIEAENQRLAKRDKLRDVQRLGYDLEVLEDRLTKFPTAEITIKKIKDEKDSNKELEVPFVTLDGKESSLDDFGNEHFPKFMPALKVNAEAQPQPKPGNSPDPKPAATQGGWWANYEKKLEERREAKKAQAPSLDAAFGRTNL